MMKENCNQKNKTALIIMIIAAVFIGIILTLPIYTFTSNIYTKKSSNTFVGDEKYVEAKAEAEVILEEYKADGSEAVLSETVTERTNSKGETTSLVTFTISVTFTKNAWAFIGCGLPSGIILICMVIFTVLAIICAIAGTTGTMGVLYKTLEKREKSLRNLSGVSTLLAFLLCPVFIMINTYNLSQKLSLYNKNVWTEGKEEFFSILNKLLYGGTLEGKGLDNALSGLTYVNSWVYWMVLLCLFAMIIAAIEIRHGIIKTTLFKGFMYAFIVICCIVTLYPYYVMLISAFRSNAETTDMYFQYLFPTKWEFGNLTHIIQKGVPRYLLNSVIVAGGATVIAMVCGIPAAYAMARMNFKLKNAYLGFIIVSQMFSPIVLLVGICRLMDSFSLTNSLMGLVLIDAAFNMAFAIWLLRGTFLSISPEMEQAARIDGCNTMGSLWHILLPMSAPGIVTTLIFVFINAWNEYTVATVLISTTINKPITVGITQFSSFNMIEWQYLFASSILATIPVVILFIFIEKHLVSGLTSGGVKG